MANVARCRRLVAVVALSLVVLLSSAPALGQPPPLQGGPTTAPTTQIEQALEQLRTRDVGGGVSLAEWMHALGVRLWGSFALSMIGWQAIQIALGGSIGLGRFIGFVFWLAVPRMILDGFYIPYPLFGNQTFVDLVTNQGGALAAALNGGPTGGPWLTAWDQVLGAVGAIIRKGLQLSVFGASGGLLELAAALAQAVQLAILYVLLVFFGGLALIAIGLAMALVYVQVLWAEIAVGMMAICGPVFVPFLLIEQLAFMFWSWFKAILQYSLQVFVGGMMMLLIGALAAGPVTAIADLVDGISPIPSDDGIGGISTGLWRGLILPILQWVPIILCCLFMSLKVGEFTAALVSGMGAPTSGMAGVALAAMTAGRSVAMRAGAMAAKRFTRAGV